MQSRLSASKCSLTTLFQFFPFFKTNTRKNEDNKCFANISYKEQVTITERAILSKEHFSVLTFIVFCGIISSLQNTVVFSLSGQSPLSVSVQLPSSYRSTRIIIPRRFPGGQWSFHFQDNKDHQHNRTKKVGKFVNLQHGFGEFPFKKSAGRDRTICMLAEQSKQTSISSHPILQSTYSNTYYEND